jgi:hypothetical protein
MAHVDLSPEATTPGYYRTQIPPRTESRRRCVRGRRRDDLSVNGGWILKSGAPVSIRMTLVNPSPELRMLGTWRTRHPLRKEKRRRCFYFHSRTHFPTPVGKYSAMQSTICFAAHVKSASSPRGVWAFRLRWVNSVYRGENKAVSIILTCPHGNDYCGHAPSRTVLLMRWPPMARRARGTKKLTSQVSKYTIFGNFEV